MILQLAHLVSAHTLLLQAGSVLMLAPILFFCQDSLYNTHRYRGH